MKQPRKKVLWATLASLMTSGIMSLVLLGGPVSACAVNSQSSSPASPPSRWHNAHTTSYHGNQQYQRASYQQNDQQDGQQYDKQADAELAAKVRSDFQEHAALTVPALKADLLNEPDRDALMQALDANSIALANDAEMAFPGSRQEVLNLWRSHISYYLDYLHASADHDAAGQARAKAQLADFSDQFSRWLAGHNHEYDQATLRQMVNEHGYQVVRIIDNLVAGNYNEVYRIAHQAYVHMGEFAAYLTGVNTGTM